MITTKIGTSTSRPNFLSANHTNVGNATVSNTSVWCAVRPTPQTNAAKYSRQRRSGSKLQRYNTTSVPARQNAFSPYTSAITACDHITGLSAINNPAATELTRMIKSSNCRFASFCRNPTFTAITCPLFEVNSVISPAASALKNADIKLIRHAMLPNGMMCCQIHAQIVQIGYPGGCGTPRWFAAVRNSPESSNVTLGASVYT